MQTEFDVNKCKNCPKITQIDPDTEKENEVQKIILKESGVKDKIGRSIEMVEILKHLDNRENRLVTIVGIPGLLKQDLSDLIAQHVY